MDWEVELAVIIGRRCKDVAEKDAYRYIAGYTVANDLSARDRGLRAAMPETSAFRYDWTYGAGAVIAVFHDVLITLAFFTMFQWEISLTVLAALLTLVGFSVNDSIVIFDRIRENLTLRRTQPLFDLTNDSINQTMSRTIVTNGLVFLSVLALVLFGGQVLRGFLQTSNG